MRGISPLSTGSFRPAQRRWRGAAFEVWHPALWQLHVWAWYPNPSGLFAETSSVLAPYGGVQGLPEVRVSMGVLSARQPREA